MSTTVIVEKMMLARSRARSALAGWVPIPLRLIVGCGFIEHGFAKMSRGSRHVRGNPGRAGSSRTPFYDMGQHFDRSAGRFGGAGGRFRDSCQHTDGNVVVRSNFHCASAERIQLSEARLSNRCWPAIRTGRLRSRPAVSGVLGSTYWRWSRAVFPGFFSSEAGTLNECVKWSSIVLLQRKGQDEKDPYGHLDGPVTGSTKPHCTCPNTVEPDCAGHH